MFLKRFLVTAVGILSLTYVEAQTCDIDTNNILMISPGSDELPCVIRGSAYQATLQFFCPPQIAGVTIDSIVVTSFSQLPVGIQYACNPPDCTIRSWERSCLVFYGTTTDTVGDYKIKYTGYAATSAGTASFAYLQNQGLLPEYYLTVIEPGTTCKNDTNTQPIGIKSVNEELSFDVYPNPASSVLHVEWGNTKLPFKKAEIYNNLGVPVRTIPLKEMTNTKLSTDVLSLKNGVYILRLVNEKHSVNKIVVIQH